MQNKEEQIRRLQEVEKQCMENAENARSLRKQIEQEIEAENESIKESGNKVTIEINRAGSRVQVRLHKNSGWIVSCKIDGFPGVVHLTTFPHKNKATRFASRVHEAIEKSIEAYMVKTA